MKKQAYQGRQVPQSTTNKSSRGENRTQFSNAQHLRRSRSKQASLMNASNLLSAEQIANLSVEQILAKYKLGQVAVAPETTANQVPQKQQVIIQQKQQAQTGLLRKHRIKHASKGFQQRRMSHEVEQPRSHHFLGSHGPDQIVSIDHYSSVAPESNGNNEFYSSQDWQQPQLSTQGGQNGSHHKRFASGHAMPSSSSASTLRGAPNETFIHNQVFRALDKILSKQSQARQPSNNTIENAPNYHNNNPATARVNSATFGQAQQAEDESHYFIDRQSQANSGYQTARSNSGPNGGSQIYFQQASHQATLQQPLVQLNSSYLLPSPTMNSNPVQSFQQHHTKQSGYQQHNVPQVQSELPAAPMNEGGQPRPSSSVGATGVTASTSKDIEQLKCSTQALTQEVQEMRNAIQAMRQGTSSLSKTGAQASSMITTQRSNVPSSRASPDHIVKQQAQSQQQAQLLIEQLTRERDEARRESQRLLKDSVAHKYTVQELKDQVRQLEEEKGDLEAKLATAEQTLLDQKRKSSPRVQLPREIHSPQPDAAMEIQAKQLLEDRLKKSQKDCQLLSTTVSGQAAKIKDQERQITELGSQVETLATQLDVKTQEAVDLEGQLEDAINVSPVKAEPERIIEVREVIKHVEKQSCESCEQLKQELCSAQETEGQLRKDLASQESASQTAEEAFIQEKQALTAQVEQLGGELDSSRAQTESERAKSEAQIAGLEHTLGEMNKQLDELGNSTKVAQMKNKYEATVKRMNTRLGDAVIKIKSLNLDVQEHKEIAESKDYEIKMLQEQQQALTKLKGKKSAQQVINQLNEQIEKDVGQIMEGRMREATLNKLIAKLQQDMAELREKVPTEAPQEASAASK